MRQVKISAEGSFLAKKTMKLFLIITVTAILCARLTMGETNNNYCGRTPIPNIQLVKLQACNCAYSADCLGVKVTADKIPVCVKGDFKIEGDHPGPFSIVYKADVKGTIMGFIPYASTVPMCDGGACSMKVTCQQLKALLGDTRTSSTCSLENGDVHFVVTTNIPGPINIPSSVVNGISNAKVEADVDIDEDLMSGFKVKIACIKQKIPVNLET
ncbi:hypothetical protein ACROYT_G001089 [Oculina patagonica]